jgi:hypothetical protein
MQQITTLSRIVERTVGLPPMQPTIAPVKSKLGYIKARLTYLTDEPKHYRSYQLAAMYGFRGPFTEEVYVLMSPRSITKIEPGIFRPAFAYLQRQFVISPSARLVSATLFDEDTSTLAYVVK